MTAEETFDSFYRSTREHLVLQAFLLTGDLTAATSAVKDAYVITWQHWRKVSLRPDQSGGPLSFTRPLAWRLASRRHTGRIWHRNKGLTDTEREVLDAVHQLTGGERRALLLFEVAEVPLAAGARELAITQDVATRRHAKARLELTERLGEGYQEKLRALSGAASRARLPRTQTVQRHGRDRRRVTAVAAVAVAIALTVAMGAVAHEPGEDRDTTARSVLPQQPKAPAARTPELPSTRPDQLLQPDDLATLPPTTSWVSERTDPNTGGDGINMICQTKRFADRNGLSALVRTFTAKGKPAREALQTVEISRNERAAQRAYNTTIRWFARCQEPRLQLLHTYRVGNVGDEATLLRVRTGGPPLRGYDIGIARAGDTTTTVMMQTTRGPAIRPARFAQILSEATLRLCPSPGPTPVTSQDPSADASPDMSLGPACAGKPTLEATAPPATGEEPGFLSTIDLPPAGRVQNPWVGVPSVNALGKVDRTTRCDRANFRRAGATKARSRTWLVPEDKDLPQTFGLTQTFGKFRTEKAAKRFLQRVRASVAGCEDRELTLEVHDIYSRNSERDQVSAWKFENKVSDKVTVPIRVGFARSGNLVAKVVFFPAKGADVGRPSFQQLLHRAADRLREL